jgi:hypothetical protein
MNSAAQSKQRKIERKQRMAWGDHVETRKKSQLQILLLDRSSFTIGASTEMTIDRFVYDPDKERSLFAKVVKGAFRFFSGRQTPNSSATVETEVGTIGIRGTALDGIVGKEAVEIARDEPAIPRGTDHDKDTATLVILRGPGAATAGGLTPGRADVTAAGKTVVLDEPSLAAYIPRPGAQPIGPFRISSAGLAEVQDQLQPAVAEAAKGKGGGLLGKLLPAAAVAIGVGLLLSGGGDGGDNPDIRTQDQGNTRTPAPSQDSGQNTSGQNTQGQKPPGR